MRTLSDIQQKLEEERLLIQAFYMRAWNALLKEDYKLVSKILHNEMPTDLYDKSLNLLENANVSPNEAELQELIRKVDIKLENYYNTHKDEEIEDTNYDNSLIDIFTKRKYKK